MAMLELPHELFLMICSYLQPTELSVLAGVSKDHYLAVQQPLFSHIRITSYGALVKLVRTLMKVPIVSYISAKQRLYWHKLSDEELRERDIKHLDLLLDSRKYGYRITGADVTRCIGAVSRKCDNVKINLTLYSIWQNFAKQLENEVIPNVVKLAMYLDETKVDDADMLVLEMKIWELVFAGSTFPDLRSARMNTLVASADEMPGSINEGIDMILTKPTAYYDGNSCVDMPFYGLLNMQEIKLEYNVFLDARVLKSLFGSKIVPKHLKKLEIVNCPCLDPIRDLEALSILLQRCLQLLQWLKLHFTPRYRVDTEEYEMEYVLRINEKPEYHLCNVIRELGQRIKGLDLAVPFACNRIFGPYLKRPVTDGEKPELPAIPETPVSTLPERLIAAGYKYRRLICWNGFCRGAHIWHEMAHLAEAQGDMVSWEILSAVENKATWFVSGCLPVEFSVDTALEHPFDG